MKFSRTQIFKQIIKFQYLTYLIRRMINLNSMKIIFFCRVSPFRAEFEFKYFIRAHFITNFDQIKITKRCVFVFFICFIDGFEVYRNRQRSLMNVYEIIASFSFRKRARRVNVLSLTLGLHDSNFVDVVDALQHMTNLDEGISISINGEEVFLCAFNHMYVEDMSQQQKNFDFKSQNATLGCRFCFIVNTDRDRLDYDFVTNERFHNQGMLMIFN